MIRVSVLYQNAEDKKFDMAYYINKHMPMVKQKLGSGVQTRRRGPRIGWCTTRIKARVRCHGALGFRLCGRISKGIWASRRCHHGRHSKLHGYSAGHSAQRSENVGCGGLAQGRTDAPPKSP